MTGGTRKTRTELSPLLTVTEEPAGQREDRENMGLDTAGSV